MRAVIVEQPGGLEKLRLAQVPEPVPGPGAVRIRIAFAGCNWSDIQKRQGVYPDPVDYPVILGAEVSGIVSAVGRGVRNCRVGDRVAAIVGPVFAGGFAESCVTDSRYVIPLPSSIPFELGAAFPLVALTAYHLLHSAHRLRKGETVLIHAIGGAVGLMLTQMAIRTGAKVIGTVGTSAKAAAPLAYGAHVVVDTNQEDFVDVALEFTNGRGVDLVIDSLGADVLPRSFDALRTYGRVINIGEAAGYPDFDIRRKLYERSTSLAGFELHHAEPGSPRWKRGVRYVLDGLAGGWLEVPVQGVYLLDDVGAAQRRLEGRGVAGKLLVEVAGG